MSAALIFGLLFALMLTGMPISISLGLTVLTFLFTMTEVPIESVGLKLFSGLDNFGIMAIPFFILAGTFLTRGGVARRMIAFTTSLVGHLPGGLGLAGVAACARCSTAADRLLRKWANRMSLSSLPARRRSASRMVSCSRIASPHRSRLRAKLAE